MSTESIATPFGNMPVLVSEAIPRNTVALISEVTQKRPLTEAEHHKLLWGSDEERREVAAAAGIEVHGAVMRNIAVPPCSFPSCQLSNGHPLPHCVKPANGTHYLIMDDAGNVLRRL